MAPEQFQGLSSKASDVYSLGVILYRLLSGELPYRGTLTEIQQKIQNPASSPSVKTINPEAPAELIAICDKAMHKHADERFANAAELAHQLKAFREGRVVNIYAYSKQELLRRFLKQNKTLVIMTSLLAAAILGGGGFSLYYAKQMQQAKQHAEESLVVVTAYGEQAQKEARTIARSINNASQRLFADLNQAASLIKPNDETNTQTVLKELKSRYPKFDDIFLRNAQDISAVFSKFGEDNALNILRPIAEIQDNHLTFSFRVPIQRKGQTISYLEARMSPERVMPNFLPTDTHSATHPRHVWIMRDDGLIVFDELLGPIGSNLFIAPSTNQSSSLQAFARQMLLEDDSIGYYTSTNQQTETHKIAAWDSVNFGNGHSWKIIVNYDYLNQDTESAPIL
jgi:serine/threonine-protein kinase